jgi:regulator of sigma E protease
VTALVAILSFLVVILALVVAHELGHFISAKAKGVRVVEFGIGLPPRLFGIKRGDTIYSLNAFPLGGFVKLAGEEDPSVPGSLAGKSIGTRLLVLSSGALMNFILPFLLFGIAFMVPHTVYQGEVVVDDVSPASPAAAAGIVPGDTLLKVNGTALNHTGDLSRAIQLNLGRPVTIALRHADGTAVSVTLTPRWKPPAGQGAVGVLTRTTATHEVRESLPFWRAIPAGVVSCFQTLVLFKNGIINMIIGTAPAQFAGPVGIAQLTGQVASAGISPLLEFAAFLSINLAIFNIFPLPALDGGRIAFVVVEWIRRGKRVAPRAEALVHSIGFMLIIAFFLAITYQDIARIVRGGSLGG